MTPTCSCANRNARRASERAGRSCPAALRAVGTAVGHNPIAYLIPCHRVIRKLGEFGNYRYGTARKKALLGWESAAALNSMQA